MVESAGTDEVWLGVVGFDVFYEVSDCGRVRSLDRVRHSINSYGKYSRIWPGRVLVLSVDRYGYEYLALTDAGGRSKHHKVHRLVAMAFIGKPPANRRCVNHIDFNKRNNSVANLEWCSESGNHRHAYRNGMHALNNYRCPITGRMTGVKK